MKLFEKRNGWSRVWRFEFWPVAKGAFTASRAKCAPHCFQIEAWFFGITILRGSCYRQNGQMFE